MSDEVKDMDYYMNNPDEMPSDPAVLSKLMGEDDAETDVESQESDEVAAQAKVDADAKAAADIKAEADAKAAADKDADAKADGVLAKDGKNLLPFSVLESARARAKEFEQTANDQAAEIERLKAGGANTAATSNLDLMSEEDLAAVEDEMPSLGKVLRAQQSILARYAERDAQAERDEEQRIAEATKTMAAQVEDAKAANPLLITWQETNPVRYDKSYEIDQALRADPEWKSKPVAERFAEVVTRVQRHFGDPITPPKSTEQARVVKTDVKTDGEFVPGSLSDLPGGAPPGASKSEEFANMGNAQMEAFFSGMTHEQVMDHLARNA